MKKQILSASLLVVALSAQAQMKYEPISDTLKIQLIEDINLHKTGNPNVAKPLSTKSNLTVMETPQPIAIVTHEIIEQQQAKQLSDVLQNVNGLYITSSRGNSQDSFGGRGFSLGNDNIFKNGTRVNSGVFPEVSGLERVEVLKGANAMLYGNTAAGGIINMVTKKPRFNFGGSVGFSAGSWNSYKPTVDFYGPLTDNVAFRVNGAYETADSFRDLVSSEKYYFNPSFLFNLGEKSQLIVEADYLRNDFTPDFGIGAITNADLSYSLNDKVGRNVFFGTDWQYQNVEQASTNITFNQQLSTNWTLNAAASYQNYTKDYFSSERIQWGYIKNNAAVDPTRLAWARPFNKTYNEQNYGSAQVNINGEFNTGKINHKVLFGADADYSQADSYAYTLSATNNVLYLDDASTWGNVAMPSATANTKNRINTRRIGAYAQDFISLTKHWKVIAGLRWSYIENMPTINTKFSTGEKKLLDNTATSDQAFSPKVGVVYMPNENMSVFATYTNSFAANSGETSSELQSINTTGTAAEVLAQVQSISRQGIKPTTIDQYEIGLKKNIWDNALAFNISLYQIDYNNYYQSYWYQNASGAVVTPDSNLKEFAGKMRSRGVEVDITGNPTKNISIIGGFSYNNSVYLDTPEKGYIEKQRLVRTPATTANASVFYKFTEGHIKGLKIGAGAYFIGNRLAGWNDTKSTVITRNGVTRSFELEDYVTVNATIGYEWDKFSLQGKIGNIFDTENYNVHENYSVNPITPRNYYFTLTYKL